MNCLWSLTVIAKVSADCWDSFCLTGDWTAAWSRGDPEATIGWVKSEQQIKYLGLLGSSQTDRVPGPAHLSPAPQTVGFLQARAAAYPGSGRPLLLPSRQFGPICFKNGKSLFYLLQLSQKSDFPPSTTKPGIQPPRTIKTVCFTSLGGFTSCFYIFFSYISSFFFFHWIEIANMDKKSYSLS